MALSTGIVPLHRPTSIPTTAAIIQTSATGSLALAAFCRKLRLQLLKQRLAQLCPQCRPKLVLVFKMEINLTQLFRELCKTCHGLFGSQAAKTTGIVSQNTRVLQIGETFITKEGQTSPLPTQKEPIVSAKPTAKRPRAHSLSTGSGKRSTRVKSQEPLTPPSTPSKKKRRAKSSSASNSFSSDVLVCFEPTITVRRPTLAKTDVFVPAFRAIEFPPRQQWATNNSRDSGNCSDVSSLMDQTLVNRHARYEQVEKTMRLCRPQVLRSLYDNVPLEDDSMGETISSTTSFSSTAT